MSGESSRWSRRHYLQLAAAAQANAGRCTEPEMRNDFLDVATAWQQMADEIDVEADEQAPQDTSRSGSPPSRDYRHDWRQIAKAGIALIVKELNDAIDAREFADIALVPKQSALDFCFGERVFRLVLKSDAVWTPWDHLADQQVYFVLVRHADSSHETAHATAA